MLHVPQGNAAGQCYQLFFYLQFCCRSSIFVCLKTLGKMKNDTNFVCIRNDDHLGYSKSRKKTPGQSNLSLERITTEINGFCRTKEEGQISKTSIKI